jgi:WD40 repeat protein/serine/threonine protein kinase
MNHSQSSESQEEKEIFFAALDKASAEERAAFLDKTCSREPQLRKRVEDLLANHFEQDGFMETPAFAAEVEELSEPPVVEGPGSKIGRYTLSEKIGEGGCGVVYAADQTVPLSRRVAIKIIKLGMDTKQVIARFAAERQALAMMDHPNIARVFDAGTTETGRSYFVMELVQGVRITDYCDQAGLSTEKRLELFIQVCGAVQHAHQKGIIHRDLKPSNILVTVQDGVPVPKIIDFGIAKAVTGRLSDMTYHTELHQFIGTPAYMSPEQADLGGLDIDTRTDIYSLGVLLYELLVGRPPFDSETLAKQSFDTICRTIREVEPPRPSTRLSTLASVDRRTIASARGTDLPKLRTQLRGDLDWIVLKAMEKDRTRRYETASTLAAEVRRYLNNEPVLAHAPSTIYRLGKLVRRNKLGFVAAASIAIALVSALLFSIEFAVRQKAHALQLQHNIAEQDLHQGQSLCLSGDIARGMHWMARALQEAPPGSDDLVSTIRQNLGGWAPRVVRPLAVLPHRGPARCSDCSSDGTRLLTGSEDYTARLWRADTGEPIGQPMQHQGAVMAARFSPDGSLVLTASRDKTVRIWSGKDGTPTGIVLQHEASVTDALFSPDGSRILTWSGDGKARLWLLKSSAGGEALQARPVSPWLEHKVAVRATAFHPTGRLIFTADSEGIYVRSAEDGKPIGELIQQSNVTCLAVSPDGQILASGSSDKSAVLWSVTTRKQIGTPLRHLDSVTTIAFSPDGTKLVTGSRDGVARLWLTATGEPIGYEMQHGAPVLTAQFTPDGKRIVTGSENNSAMFWSAETGKFVGPQLPHEGWVWITALSPDGKRMLTGADDHAAKVWSTETHEGAALVLPHGAVVKSATFSPDGKTIATAGSLNQTWPGSARIWSARTGQPGQILAHSTHLWAAGFSPDGKLLTTTGNEGTATMWSTESFRPLEFQFKHLYGIRCVAYSKDGKYMATGGFDRVAKVWIVSTGTLAFPPLEHQGYVEDVAFSPDGKLLATACGDGSARLWSMQTGKQSGPAFAHGGAVLGATFSPDGQLLATCGAQNAARFWDVKSGQQTGKVLEHPAWVEDIAFSPDGKLVATCDAFDSAWLWSATTRELLGPPFKHAGPVNEVEFSPDGKQLLTASHDTTARVWNIPAPYTGEARDAHRWVETLTGKSMDPQGVVSWIDISAKK